MRAALYWAPRLDDPLHRLGSAWLGRDAETGATLAQPALPGLDIAEITREARGYGLHATVKPPFRLATSWAALRQDALALALRTAPFALPPLQVAEHHGFLALLETERSPALQAFADACVAGLDAHRLPPDAAEIARRRPERMTDRQRANLHRWGYHYVFEEWWFHVTLSRRLTAEEMAVVRPAVTAHLGEAPGLERRVTELCLFTQSGPGAPFLLAERLPLLG
ncbi:MAG: phosphonate metabolism protein [Rhodospirillales bacterium 12-71-4]|nr:MAG: phosphonate metabolism protein [Rhodospirillales bacterium 12-71-4]